MRPQSSGVKGLNGFSMVVPSDSPASAPLRFQHPKVYRTGLVLRNIELDQSSLVVRVKKKKK